MKLLLLNPNMSAAMTDRMTGVARAVAGPDTQILPRTAPRGFPYISSRAEAQVAGVVAMEMIADEMEPVDAVVLAAFGDPGLRAAKELFDMPVVGMAEAAILTACALGERFAIVTFAQRLAPWYAETVALSGLTARFTGVRAAPAPVGPVTEVAETMRAEVEALCRAAAEQDGADVVILGGAPLAGLAAEIDVPAVTLDPLGAAVGMAQTLARVAPRGADRGAYARPPGKPTHGLTGALGAHIANGTASAHPVHQPQETDP